MRNSARSRFPGHGRHAVASRRHCKACGAARAPLWSRDELPGRAERSGRPSPERRTLEVNIRLALPNARGQCRAHRAGDARCSDLTFAINDAFKRARRQLQVHVRKLQGLVKQHEGPPIGTIVRLDPSGEFGFLKSGDGREMYFTATACSTAGFPGWPRAPA